MNKIAVVFPGVGYTKDRPLLYYAGKMAVKNGYKLIHLDFSGLEWSKEKLKDPVFLNEALQICLDKADSALCDKNETGAERFAFSGSENIIFISKSIGTVVACAYARRKGLNVRHICFSPLKMIDEYIDSGDKTLLVYGDDDPYADHIDIERIASGHDLETICISGGNHSLETGDILTDIDNLKTIMEKVHKYTYKQ